MENELAKDLRSAGAMVKYDAQVKKVLSSRIILAWIMHYTIGEFAGLAPAEIVPYIEGEPQVSMAQAYAPQEKIQGSATEDGAPGMGTVNYDIKFWVTLPLEEETAGTVKVEKDSENASCPRGEKDSENASCPRGEKDSKNASCSRGEKVGGNTDSGRPVKIIINVEAQKKFYPGYCIESRGVFYCSRMVSSQLGTEFKEPHYDGIKKVYSIWICLNAPKYAGGAIAEYSFSKKDILPGMRDRRWAYDKQAVILICLNGKSKKGNELIRMLTTLLSQEMDFATKKEKLEEHGICMGTQMETEVQRLCNLSMLVKEEGRREGRKEGRREEQEFMVLKMLMMKKYNDEEILMLSEIGKDRLESLKKQLWKRQ